MSPGAFTRVFGSTLNTVFKRFGVTLLKTFFIYLISLLFVQLPTLWNVIMTLGKDDENSKIQKRIRAKLINPSDPSSPYRAIEVFDELRTTPDEHVQTLADIPDYCLERFADKETLGVREILDVQDEKQPNGKIFKKVFVFFIKKNLKKKYIFFD
jgi:long-chain acyl-CoA synthetase